MPMGATSPLVHPFPAIPLGKCEFMQQNSHKELQVSLLDPHLNTATHKNMQSCLLIFWVPLQDFSDSESLGNPLLNLVGPSGFDCTTWL